MLNIDNEAINLPVLILRDSVVFPKIETAFDVTIAKNENALDAAMESDRLLFVVTQSNFFAQDPERKDLYDIGSVVRIKQTLKMTDSVVKVLLEGIYRAKFSNFKNGKKYCTADVEKFEDKDVNRQVYKEAMFRRVKTIFEEYSDAVETVSPGIRKVVEGITDLDILTFFIANHIPLPYADKQHLLEQSSPVRRAKVLVELLIREREIGELEQQLSEKIREGIDDNQREYYLREQMRAISDELYGEDTAEEIDNYYAKIDALNADDNVKETLKEHVIKLSKMPDSAHEGTVERGYLDTCLALPWNNYSKVSTDIKRAARILDRDIYGMDKVKERILELLSVYALSPDVSGQIICLSGPPGVGKTSIGKSVAECMGRSFARISLGGISDEAEIRGHRKTYIGAMPGKIMEALKRAKTGNPVILLDEIDKLGNDYKGDPSSALLEVLDPEQNSTFVDHFVEIPYDLSHTLFISTANNIETIPAPLRDRMEIIELSSYTREEKFNIAKKHLINKQITRCGLNKRMIKITDSAVYSLIDF